MAVFPAGSSASGQGRVSGTDFGETAFRLARAAAASTAAVRCPVFGVTRSIVRVAGGAASSRRSSSPPLVQANFGTFAAEVASSP